MCSLSYEELKDLYLSGISLSSIEKTHGYNRKKLASLLQKEGICIPRNNQQYTYCEDVFNEIASEESAYWLGFLYADGYVSNESRRGIELCLAEIDKDHVIKFRDWICPDKPVEEKIVTLNGKQFKSYRVSLTNKHIRETLISLGCIPNKSLVLNFPKNIRQDLMRHFLRGYVDGDGSVGLYSGKAMFDICSGSEQFVSDFQKYMAESIDGYSSVKIQKDKRSNVFKIAKGGNSSVISILDYFYKDAKVFLKRKYDKYQEILRVKLPSEKEIPQIIRAELSVEAVKP